MSPLREIVYEDEDVVVFCDYLLQRTKAALHLTFKRAAWTHNKFKKYCVLFDGLLLSLKEKNYAQVYATPFENDIKAQKLIAMFGFKEFDRQHGFVLMKRGV